MTTPQPNSSPERPEDRPSARALGDPVVRAAGGALLAVAILFLGYELVERRWLTDWTDPELHRLHRVRGIISSVVAVSLAVWLLIRSLPEALRSPLTGEQAATAVPEDASVVERRYALWFIRMRWTALVVAVILVVLSVEPLHLLPHEALGPLLATLTLLAATNVWYVALLAHPVAPRFFLERQAYLDLLLLTVLLHFSGGMENPLTPMMLLHVIIAGAIMSRGQCYLVATVGTVMVAVMAGLEWSGAIGHYTLAVFPHPALEGEVLHAAHHGPFVLSRAGLHGAILYLTAYFATTLAARIRAGERELERSAEQLQTQAQMLQQALETTGTALRVRDRDRRRAWSNARWDALDHAEEERPEAAALLDSAATDTLADGTVRHTEIVVPGADAAEERTFHVTTAPLYGSGDAISRVAELAQDVTDEKRAQRLMVRAERLAAVGELAGKVAHEVNNPIGIISAKARLLLTDERDGMSEHTAGELGKIVDLADRVAGIARGLLSYGRPSPAARTRLDVRATVRQALAHVTPAAAAGVRIVDALPAELPPVRANGGELEQVFLNLLLNALDAMPGGGTLTVSGATRTDGSAPALVAVAVTDTGQGIPRELREQVFEPFFSTKAHGKGTGLGLAICAGIVRGHGGTIELDSEPGRGTGITVVLPAEPGPEVA